MLLILICLLLTELGKKIAMDDELEQKSIMLIREHVRDSEWMSGVLYTWLGIHE